MPRLQLERQPIYFVTDHFLNGGRSKLDNIAAALEAGVTLVQFRDKELDETAFEQEAAAALAMCRNQGALLIVNDRVDIARRIGADGVHLGQDDARPEEARRVLGDEAIIGLSTHGRDEVLAARGRPLDYINIGPMFPTATKEHSRYGALGMDTVLDLSRLSAFPCTAMGGIKKRHVREILSRGMRTVAVVTAISQAPDPLIAARELLREAAAAGRGED